MEGSFIFFNKTLHYLIFIFQMFILLSYYLKILKFIFRKFFQLFCNLEFIKFGIKSVVNFGLWNFIIFPNLSFIISLTLGIWTFKVSPTLSNLKRYEFFIWGFYFFFNSFCNPIILLCILIFSSFLFIFSIFF